MDWAHLLSSARLGGGSNVAQEEGGRSPFNRDYGRVLYSSAFRRLQDKTQVFPLGRNDYVRTRLTHSLEVSNVGRTLAQNLVRFIRTQKKADGETPIEAIEDIVATVCLAHDIGNPPFGHSGEKAIESALRNTSYENYSFEGNAQGFRLLSRICDPIRNRGLNLTSATLASFVKYPQTKAGEKADAAPSFKKFGLNDSELDLFRQAANNCHLPPTSNESWRRHPLAFLMEAADDISYLIADLEDAYISNIITFPQAVEQLNSLIGSPLSTEKLKQNADKQGKTGTIRLLRATAIGSCIRCISDVIQERYSDLMNGSLTQSLFELSIFAKAYQSVRDFSAENIYNSEQVVRVEITGYNVISQLIRLYMEWVRNPNTPLGRKIASTLHVEQESQETEEERFQLMIDHVSGMTDSCASQTYRALFGF